MTTLRADAPLCRSRVQTIDDGRDHDTMLLVCLFVVQIFQVGIFQVTKFRIRHFVKQSQKAKLERPWMQCLGLDSSFTVVPLYLVD